MSFWSRLRHHSTHFLEVENLILTWAGYGDDVIDRDTRDNQEYDTENRLSLSGPSPAEPVAEIAI